MLHKENQAVTNINFVAAFLFAYILTYKMAVKI
jgi:hypothetical protein